MLAGEIFNSETDLRHHRLAGNAQYVAGQLVVITRGLSKRASPTNCGELLASYLILRER